jgi:hypothetical protein
MTSIKTSTHPNFFIVGASRSGTTSLWYYLRQHPDIFMPGDRVKWAKEPSFFCDLKPFWSIKYSKFRDYIKLFDRAKNEKAIGEASVNYLVSPESPYRIRKRFPDAKIIIILRNPVERAYSLYTFMCSKGGEWISPFEKALAEEKKRHNNEDFMNHNPFYYYGYLYFHSGLYSTQIERFQAEFPKEQLHFVLFKELKNNTIQTVQSVYRFLEVKSDFIPRLGVHNRSRQPFSVYAQYIILQFLGSYLVKAKVPERAARFATDLASSINLTLGKMLDRDMKTETYENLLMLYKKDIMRTEVLTGLDLNSWLNRA